MADTAAAHLTESERRRRSAQAASSGAIPLEIGMDCDEEESERGAQEAREARVLGPLPQTSSAEDEEAMVREAGVGRIKRAADGRLRLDQPPAAARQLLEQAKGDSKKVEKAITFKPSREAWADRQRALNAIETAAQRRGNGGEALGAWLRERAKKEPDILTMGLQVRACKWYQYGRQIKDPHDMHLTFLAEDVEDGDLEEHYPPRPSLVVAFANDVARALAEQADGR